MRKFATQIARCDSIERASALFNMLSTCLGGPQHFFDFWFDEIERLKVTGRHPARLIRFCEMLFNAQLLWDGREMQRRNRIGSPEWCAATQNEIRQLVQSDPDFIVAAAEQLGGKVIWAKDIQAASA